MRVNRLRGKMTGRSDGATLRATGKIAEGARRRRETEAQARQGKTTVARAALSVNVTLRLHHCTAHPRHRACLCGSPVGSESGQVTPAGRRFQTSKQRERHTARRHASKNNTFGGCKSQMRKAHGRTDVRKVIRCSCNSHLASEQMSECKRRRRDKTSLCDKTHM